jgi:hypothetical protein
MEFRFVLQTIFEIVVAAFIIYGLFFEEKFAQTERELVARILGRAPAISESSSANQK